MPQAVAAAAAKAAEVISGAVYSALTTAGVSAGTASLISTYAASITAVSVATLAYVGPSLLFRPSIPDPEFARSARKQAIPDRVSGYGRARVGGAYMLWEAVGTKAYVVLAQVDGLSDGVEQLYLNDQKEEVGSDGFVQQGSDLRYGVNSDLVQIAYRNGLPTETRYPLIPSDIWPDNARGDGVASLMMICKSSSKEQFLRDYPNALPTPSTVRRLQLCWDPRLGARGTIDDDGDKLASSTWQWTDNPILQLLDYKTAGSGGPGYPIEKFLPRIDDWIEAANVCDELVALKEGGTEKRYRAGGTYLHSTADADVTATILATCDGWLAQDIDGNFTVQAGKYYEPTVIITADHILGMSIIRGKKDEEATNVMVVSFTDPTFDFTEVETNPLRNEANIDLIGVERDQRLSLPWVQSNSQAQRLGKIALNKQTQPISGTITTTLDGLRAWGERRIRFQADPNESEDMADIVVDILPVTLNPDFTVSIPFVSCDPDGYDWNAAVDEGEGAGGDVRPPLDPIETPAIDSIVPFVGAGTTRLRIYPDGALSGSSYIMRWRVTGDTAWTQSADQIVTAGYFETSPVTPAGLDVQIALVTSGGAQSEWSATLTVDASAPAALWTPANAGGAVLGWWDAKETATLTRSAGTVSAWSSRTGGHVLSQATAATQPSWSATAFPGSLPGVLFDGAATNGDLMTSSTGPFDSDGWIFLAVSRGTQNTDASVATRTILRTSVSGFLARILIFNAASDPSQNLVRIAGSGTGSATGSDATFTAGGHVLWGNLQDNALITRTDGQAAGTTGDLGTDPLSVFELGGNSAAVAAERFAGVFGEILIIDKGGLAGGGTSAERERFEGYLAWKWGLQAKLPSGHPYKASAPTV